MYEQQFNPFAANLAIVKGYFKSGKTLTIGILNTIMALFNVFSVVYLFQAYHDYFFLTLRYMGLPQAAGSSILSMSYVIACIGSIWYVLQAVGFFLIFAKSRNTSPESSPRGGFNLLKVLAVFQLIGAIIGAVFMVIIAFVFIAGGSGFARILINYLPAAQFSPRDASALTLVMVVLGIIFIAYAFFLIFEAINRLRFLNGARKSMNSVDLYSNGAGAYGVVCVILAVFAGFGLIGNLFTFNVVTVLSSILTLLTFIFTAALALGYNRYIQKQKLSYHTNTPNGAPTPQAPYASAPVNPAPAAPQATPYANPVEEQPRSGGFCMNCGAPVGPNDPFCGNCGKKL